MQGNPVSPPPQEPLLTTAEAAVRLNLHEQTVREMAEAGELPGAHRFGRVWRFHWPTIERWLEAGRGRR